MEKTIILEVEDIETLIANKTTLHFLLYNLSEGNSPLMNCYATALKNILKVTETLTHE